MCNGIEGILFLIESMKRLWISYPQCLKHIRQ